MAIYRKTHVAPYLRELETYHLALCRAVEGEPPSADNAHRYHADPAQFADEFTDIDFEQVLYYVEHFSAAVKYLKGLKSKAMKPVHRP